MQHALMCAEQVSRVQSYIYIFKTCQLYLGVENNENMVCSIQCPIIMIKRNDKSLFKTIIININQTVDRYYIYL